MKRKAVRIAKRAGKPSGAPVLGEATSARVVVEIDLVRLYSAFQKTIRKLPPARRHAVTEVVGRFLEDVGAAWTGGKVLRREDFVGKRAKRRSKVKAKS